MMKKLILPAIVFLLSTISVANAMVVDAPHNETKQITCVNCHSYSLWWQYSPSTTHVGPNDHQSIVVAVCTTCHVAGGSAPVVATHSSVVIGGSHNAALGDWSRTCTDCHDPHFQAQLNWYSLPDELYLLTGSLNSGTLTVSGDGSSSSPYYSTFAYSSLVAGTHSYWDATSTWKDHPAEWAKKSGNDGRGLIVALPSLKPSESFEIHTVNEAASTITVQGLIPATYNNGASFGLVYGQLIRDEVNNSPVKFYNPKLTHDSNQSGGFVDPNNRQGICQVCHTKTKNWSYNGQYDNAGTIISSETHHIDTPCTKCHKHDSGFAPAGGGKHDQHFSQGLTCVNCHGSNSPPLMGDGKNLADTTVCSVCHNDGTGAAPNKTNFKDNWQNDGYYFGCFGCHKGRPDQATDVGAVQCNTTVSCQSCHQRPKTAFCTSTVCADCHNGTGLITGLAPAQDWQRPAIGMQSNGHNRLVSTNWIRMYPCSHCHANTVDAAGNLLANGNHLNGSVEVAIDPQFNIVGKPAAAFDPAAKICDNVYCHTDGTSVNPEVRPYPWNGGPRDCNACHGHNQDNNECVACHNDGRTYTPEQKWMSAMPMYTNGGPGSDKANSHMRHIFTGFSCEECHAKTIIGSCFDCHGTTVPTGKMSESQHVDPVFHVNKERTVFFKQGGAYDAQTKSCSNTACHTGGTPPVWGESVNNSIICYECHLSTDPDVDDFGIFNGIQAKINLSQWETSGHGRPASAGNYPVSGNPAANFPAKGCWYCHDNTVLHKTASNPFRLRQHDQFNQRFKKECVYCHMEGKDTECLGCHNSTESLAPQLANITAQPSINPPFTISRPDHSGFTGGCGASNCHVDDSFRHKTGTGVWTAAMKDDIRNSYVMMGVCLKCHDDNSGGQCTSCHTGPQYINGFSPDVTDPQTPFITASSAMASSVHFGYKHYADYTSTGVWKGGKFCWDCHDPHGDNNIYMIQNKVATETDGRYGQPVSRADVVFTQRQSGLDYARSVAPYNGICNVCHTDPGQHYRADGGDSHNAGRRCTECHEHRFTDSHASKKVCTTCHVNKPIERHTAFGLPMDCTKCHKGNIGKRMNIIGQFKANSHHVQGVEISNKHCYACHWEATPDGLINIDYHSGYNYKTHQSVKNAEVNLVIWEPGQRPTVYQEGTTATTFLPSQLAVGIAEERGEIEKITPHCLGCHSAQNSTTEPFNDCRTPIQYSWDGLSIDERYSDLATATFGKYTDFANAAKKNLTKAFSAHGNAVNNQGGWSAVDGVDGAIVNTRAGSYNIQCFDCHSSHGSRVSGITTSYETFNGTKNGGNLKETQAGKGGYTTSYTASANPNPAAVNFYNAGAGECFDCHETANAGTTPWGYSSTFGASAPIIGYKDNPRFNGTYPGRLSVPALPGKPAQSAVDLSYRQNRSTMGGHFNASSPLENAPMGTIDGLCTPCHDPHGISPTLGNKMAYAQPMLKGTWLTSPFKEDMPPPDPYGSSTTPDSWGRYSGHPQYAPEARYNTDRTTFGAGNSIYESAEYFAGLCLRCHPRGNLEDGIAKDQPFKSRDRIHESVKGWGTNSEHSYTCSKCHQPHASGLPRLLKTDCLNYRYRGGRAAGGTPQDSSLEAGSSDSRGEHRGYPVANVMGNSASVNPQVGCHAQASDNPGTWPDNIRWNQVTPWNNETSPW